jgi:hypothetical protein
MHAAPPLAPRPTAASPLKPSQTAQEFRWKFLKGQQLHATRLSEPAPEADDDTLQWKEAGVFPCQRYNMCQFCIVITRIQRTEALLQPRGPAAAVWSLMTIVSSSEEP